MSRIQSACSKCLITSWLFYLQMRARLLFSSFRRQVMVIAAMERIRAGHDIRVKARVHWVRWVIRPAKSPINIPNTYMVLPRHMLNLQKHLNSREDIRSRDSITFYNFLTIKTTAVIRVIKIQLTVKIQIFSHLNINIEYWNLLKIRNRMGRWC